MPRPKPKHLTPPLLNRHNEFLNPQPNIPTMSNTKLTEMIKHLQIPDTIPEEAYPVVNFNIEDNIFSVIGAVSKGWRTVDKQVADRISAVVNEHAEDYDQAIVFLLAVTNVEFGDYDDE